MTLKHKNDPINGIFAPKNIGKVVLHMVLVQIGAAVYYSGAAVYYSLLLAAAILDFVQTGL